jgi:hypothetical protein
MKTNPTEVAIRRSGRRILQYELVDGSFELLFAVLFLLMGGILFVQAAMPRSLWSDLLAGPGFLIFFPGVAYLLDRLVRRLKERLTWPRSGYLVRKPAPEVSPQVRRTIYIGIPVLTLLILSLLAIYRPILIPAGSAAVTANLPIFTIFFSLMLSGVWILIGWRLGLRRFFLVALLTLAIGAGTAFSLRDDLVSLAASFAAEALVLGISGLVTLLAYMRRNPLPVEDDR